MHQAAAEKQPAAPAVPPHQDRAYEFVECPMRAAAGAKSDIDPTNMVGHTTHVGQSENACLLQLTLIWTCWKVVLLEVKE